MVPNSLHWRGFFVLAALEAGAAFLTLALVPHEGSAFSLARLSLLALPAASCVLWIYLAIRPPRARTGFLRPSVTIVSAFLALTFAVALFLLRYLNLKHADALLLLSYYQRVSPVLLYLILLGLEYSLFTLVCRYGLRRAVWSERSGVFRASLAAFCALLLVLGLVVLTRIGLVPDRAYWGEPGVPLLGWQFALALLGGVLVLCLALRWPSRRSDAFIAVALFILAAVLWLSVPVGVMQNSFYAPMGPPANVPFPNSDAGYYDSMAQSLLIGYPYQGDIPTRPLYIVFLTVLHALFGQSYPLIIAGQTLVLALIPVLLYMLGRRLHSRTAGVIVALFAIFREWTSLLISSQTRVSNTKTLLVDLPTLLLILLACWFVLRWLERKEWSAALAAGGIFGWLMLLRTQSLLILPLILLAGLPVIGWKEKKSYLRLSAFFLLGVVCSVVPWLLHNYLASGQITFDAPFEYQLIASQYKYTGNLNLQSINLQGTSLFGILLTFALQDPKFVFGFIATHFFATQINGVLALPLIEKYQGLSAPLNLYWMNWDGRLEWYNLLLVVVYLAVIALGLGASWRRLRWMGLVPMVFSLGYSLANGVGRFSGWRYDLPADWAAYFYAGIGLAELLGLSALLLGAGEDGVFTPLGEDRPRVPRRISGLLLAGLFVLVGALPWMAEGAASPRYANQTPQLLVSRLASSSAVSKLVGDPSNLSRFLQQNQATVRIGRVLYPRFFYRGFGLTSSNPWPAYAARDLSRMGFLLLNQTRMDAIFPSKTIPDPFPQGADAILLGCRQSTYVEVRLIFFPDSDSAFLSSPLSLPCTP